MKFNLNKEISIVALGQIVTLIGSFLFIKLISNVTSVEEYGIYALSLSIISLLALLPFSSFDQAISRLLPEYKNRNIYITNVITMYFCIMFLFFSFVLYGVSQAKFDFFGPINQIIINVILFAILNITRNFLLNLENSMRNRSIVTLSKVFEAIMKLVIIYVLSFYINISASILITVINLILFINICLLVLKNKNLFDISLFNIITVKEIYKKILSFSSPLLMWTLFSWFTLNAPIWILQENYNSETVGHFSMINNLANLFPIQLIGILSVYYSPIFYENELKTIGYTRNHIAKVFLVTVLLFSSFGIILYNFTQEIILLVSSQLYLEYSWMMIYLYVNSVILSLGQLLSIEIFVYKETKKLILANIIPALIMVMGFFLVPKYEITGLLYIMLLSTISYITIVSTQLYKVRKIKLRSFYD